MHDNKVPDARSIKQAYKRMQGLQHVTSELSKAVTKRDVARTIINEGFQVLQADSGDIVLASVDKHFEVIAYKGYPKEFVGEFTRIQTQIPLLTRNVVRTKKPYFIANIRNLNPK